MPFYFNPYLPLKPQMCWHHCGYKNNDIRPSSVTDNATTDNCLGLIVKHILMAFFFIRTSHWNLRFPDTVAATHTCQGPCHWQQTFPVTDSSLVSSRQSSLMSFLSNPYLSPTLQMCWCQCKYRFKDMGLWHKQRHTRSLTQDPVVPGWKT